MTSLNIVKEDGNAAASESQSEEQPKSGFLTSVKDVTPNKRLPPLALKPVEQQDAELDQIEDAITMKKEEIMAEEQNEEATHGDLEEKLKEYRRHRNKKRHAAMLYDHNEMKNLFAQHYGIDNIDTTPLDPLTVNNIMCDVFDDLSLFSKIMKDDKRGRWADAWEFGVGMLFGILILIGSIFIAMDAGKENPIICKTGAISATNTRPTTCDREKNMIGQSGMLAVGTWTVVAGSFGFIAVVLWRIVVKIRLAWKHHLTLNDLGHDIATDGSASQVEKLSHTQLSAMLRKLDKHGQKKKGHKKEAVKAAESRMYRQAPSFYAPRSAYSRAAGGYGSPLMC